MCGHLMTFPAVCFRVLRDRVSLRFYRPTFVLWVSHGEIKVFSDQETDPQPLALSSFPKRFLIRRFFLPSFMIGLKLGLSL